MISIEIPVQAALVPQVQDIRPSPDGAMVALVTWRLQSGRIMADVLQDQVRLDASWNEDQVSETLAARGQEVAGQYLTVEAGEAVLAMRQKLGLA